MEAVTDAGTRLLIQPSQSFDGGTDGRNVLHIDATDVQGGEDYSATYMELSQPEAKLVSWVLSNIVEPTPELKEATVRYIQDVYPSMSKEDSQKLCEITLEHVGTIAERRFDLKSKVWTDLAIRFEQTAVQAG